MIATEYHHTFFFAYKKHDATFKTVTYYIGCPVRCSNFSTLS